MSKIITIPSSIDEINKTKNLVNGFIIGIKNMCVNTNYLININELELLNNLTDKEIFISINKNMHTTDLKLLEDLLIKLNNYNIKGILFYDIAVLNIYNRLNLNYDLIYSAEHLLTNYNTVNYWNDFNVKYSYLSSDITKDEVVDIIKHTKSKLFINLFGYLPMFVSRRHIVDNYLNHFNITCNSNKFYLEKENKIYPIIDNNVGTYCYSSNILNGIRYYNLDVEYIVLNSFNIDIDKFIKVINYFNSVDENNVDKYELEINNLFSNTDYGFLNTKTIYRVKKNEK